MPVAVCGMHRSGTSMITRMLNLCGLELGSQDRLMPASKDNEKGYWECADLSVINDSILTRFAGGWDLPPQLPAGWAESPGLEALRVAARERLDVIKAPDGRWGWKDPRTTVLLPFWRQLEPDLTVVACVRNPLAVALSLQRRNDTSIQYGLHLWAAYNQILVNTTTPAERIVTLNEAYSIDPVTELERVARFIGLDPSSEQLETATSFREAALDHHAATLADLVRAGATVNVIELYLRLMTEAGASAQRVLERDPGLIAQLVPQFEQIGMPLPEAVQQLEAAA